MADYLPDNYEETRRRLGIPNELDTASSLPVEPFLVRQSRRVDARLRRSELLISTLKQAARPARKAAHIKRSLRQRSAQAKNQMHKKTPKLPEKVILPKHSPKPDVSIIIPVFNKLETTLDCLRSLSVIKTRYSYEVVISDNASSDGTQGALSKIENLTYVRNSTNLGFVDGCNVGFKHSSGGIIVFLNNDTIVTDDWLDLLVEPLLSDPSIGLVGSKLLYPNGTLQEAGGIIFKDGSGTNYGKYQLADYYLFNYRREVDYCSGASVAISRKLFSSLGGFDRRYAPAYYEDTDLAFQVRQKGLRVVYEPRSVAYHIEGKTAGTNLNSGFKKYQNINREKFLSKWGKILSTNHYNPEEWYKARDRSGNKLVLIIDDRVPTPDKDSGSQRMVRLIDDFIALGYKVTLWPLGLEYDNKYVPRLQQKGVEVVYGDVDFISFARDFGRYYDTVVLSRAYIAAKYLEACRAWFYRARLLYDTVDLHFLRTERQAENEPDNKEGLLDQARGYKELEIGIARRTDATLVVSEIEREIIKEIDPSIQVAVVSNIHTVVESAYDCGYKDREDLLFIGGFDHLPNQDSVKWFVQEIFPAILKKNPAVQFHIVGARMPEQLKNKLQESKNVNVHGFVEDVSELFTKAKVFVCPLRFGAGVKGKIGQAIEYGVPVVSTDIGVEGMHLEHDKSCLVANDAKQFAKETLRLYEDVILWEKLQAQARKSLEKNFSHESARKGLKSILG